MDVPEATNGCDRLVSGILVGTGCRVLAVRPRARAADAVLGAGRGMIGGFATFVSRPVLRRCSAAAMGSADASRLQEALQHERSLRRLAAALLGDAADADDAVQHVLVQEAAGRRRDGVPLWPFLCTALRRHAANLRKLARRRTAHERRAARPEATPAADRIIERDQLRRRVADAVLGLDEPYRTTVWLRWFEELPTGAVAQRMRVPVATVRTRLQRAHARLRQRLDADYGDGRWAALAMPIGAAALACPSILLPVLAMKKTLFAVCAVVLLVCTFEVVRPSPDRLSPGPAAPAVAIGGSAVELDQTDSPPPPNPVQREPVQRDAVAAKPAPRPDTITVEVTDAATAAPVAGATVWFVRPGFAHEKLTAAEQEQYSYATDAFLAAHGTAQVAGADGRTRIPTAAAQHVVIACQGDRHGTATLRGDGDVLSIAIASRGILVVETVDARGAAVPRVTVQAINVQRVGSAQLPFGTWFKFGTTGDDGRLTRVGEAAGSPARLVWLRPALLGAGQPHVLVDLQAPPATAVRLLLPATGTVRARLVDANAALPEPGILAAVWVELTIEGEPVGAERHFARIDASGHATFALVELGRRFGLCFHPLLDTPSSHRGPTPDEPVVTVSRSLGADHPFVVGTLVDAAGEAVGEVEFGLFCRGGPPARDLLATAGGRTDRFGRFQVYLSEGCTGRAPVELTFGVGVRGAGYEREAVVGWSVPLYGRVDLGRVVMPAAK